MSLSPYVPGSSGVHRLHPLTKAVYAAAAIAAAFTSPSAWLAFVIALSAVPLVLRAGTLRPFLRLLRNSVLLLFLSLFVIQGLFYPYRATILFRLGPLVFWVEGLRFAAETAARLLTLVTTTGVVILTTPPGDLMAALVQKGLSHKLAYAILLTMQIIPEMQRRASTILDAQRSRGLETEGHLLQRARAYLPLLGPLVMGSLVGIETRALALEARAFGSPRPKTRLQPLVDSPAQARLRRLMALAALAVLTWRLALWLSRLSG